MKWLLLLLIPILFVCCKDQPDTLQHGNPQNTEVDESYMQKAFVSQKGSISITSDIRLDHRIFGYEKPDTTARKMILLSVFTSDVEGNPFKCPFGSYYETSGMDSMSLEYIGDEGSFIKVGIMKDEDTLAIVHIEKKGWSLNSNQLISVLTWLPERIPKP